MNAHLLCGLNLEEAKALLKNEKFTGTIEVVAYNETITLEARYNTATLFMNQFGFVATAWVS